MPYARPIALPDDYWRSYEHSVSTLAEFTEAVRQISAYQAATGSRFVWRGAANADWPLHPSLVRAYMTMHGQVPMEPELRSIEAEVMREAREWSLDWHQTGGRLAALELLAALQHYGVPTRMLDFTFNPLIALWFAVEQHSDRDGRVFALDISDRLVSRERAMRDEPWWLEIEPGTTTEWAREAWIWRPPPMEPRIVRQEGCFLMGGIPSTNPYRRMRRGGAGTDWIDMHAEDVRACMSVPFRLITYDRAEAAAEGRGIRGAPAIARAFTLRVCDKARQRTELEQAFGYSHRSLFPDFPGFRDHGLAFRVPPAG